MDSDIESPLDKECVVSGLFTFVLFLSRLAGIAPVKFVRTYGGWCVRVSLFYTFYSYILLIVFISIMLLFYLRKGDDFGHGRTAYGAYTDALRCMAFACLIAWIIISSTLIHTGHSRMCRMINYISQLKLINAKMTPFFSSKPKNDNSLWFLVSLCFGFVTNAADYGIYMYDLNAAGRVGVVSSLAIAPFIFALIIQMYTVKFALVVMMLVSTMQRVNNSLKDTLHEIRGDYTNYHMSKIINCDDSFTTLIEEDTFSLEDLSSYINDKNVVDDLNTTDRNYNTDGIYFLKQSANETNSTPFVNVSCDTWVSNKLKYPKVPLKTVHAFISNPATPIEENVAKDNNNQINTVIRIPRYVTCVIDIAPVKGNGEFSNAEKIRQLSIIYCALCDIIKQLNTSNGSALFMMLVFCFMYMITTPYFMFNVLFTSGSEVPTVKTISVFVYFWFCFIVLATAVEPCHRTQEQLLLTKDLICNMLRYAGPEVDAVRCELKLFQRHIFLNPVHFSPLKLLAFDRTTLVLVVSTVVTKLTVMMYL